MYKYETHLHTLPVSRCAKAGIEESLAFYKSLGYAGVFLTNHFLDGNINCDRSLSYETQLDFYYGDYQTAKEIGEKIGLDVFFGVELSYKGTDFLVYGADYCWWKAHPEVMKMNKKEELTLLRENGFLVIHAHPFREDFYIDHIRLYPSCVDGVEVINANRKEIENRMALIYAEEYHLLKTAGTDNHNGPMQRKLAGMISKERITDEWDFVEKVRKNEMEIFSETLDEL